MVAMLREGAASRVLLLALSGGNAQELAEASQGVAVRLRDNPLFLQVSNGSDDMGGEERMHWFRYRYLLSPAVDAQNFSELGLRVALQSRLDELSTPLGVLTKKTLPDDPLAAFSALLQQWQPETTLQYRHGVWFGSDGGTALLLAVTKAGGFDLDAQQQAITAVYRALSELPQAGRVQLSISGSGNIGVLMRDTIRNESQWLSLVASTLVVLLLWWVYRSLRLLLLVAMPLLSSLMVGTAVTLSLFGSVHGITLAFGMTLLGVVIDYPLHLFSHMRAQEPAQQTLQRIWPTLFLGMLSTAMGYLAMVFSDFAGLQQLAVFAISGLLAAAVVVRWVMPPLLAGHTTEVRLVALDSRGVGFSARYAPLGMLIAAFLGLLYLALSPRTLWQSDLSALSPVPERLRTQDSQLRKQLAVADLSHLLLVDGESAEQVLQRCETLKPELQHLRDQGVIGSFLLPSDLLPSVSLQRRRQQMLPNELELMHRLQSASHEFPFKSGLFAPFVSAVAESAVLLPLTPEAIADTMLGLRLQPMLRPVGGQWTGNIQLKEVYAAPQLAQWAYRQGAGVAYLDVKAITAQMVTRFRNEALAYLLGGLMLIVLLLRLGLHGWQAVLGVLLPVATALSLTLALLHALGMVLSLFNLVALLLVLGIGIDYGLFFSRREQGQEHRRTGHALALCAISTVSVFGILALSHIPVLRAIGLTVAVGVALTYLLARWGRKPAIAG